MEPYYKTDNGKLYHGKFEQVLPALVNEGIKVDCIITDPPYGMGYQSNYRKDKHDVIENDDRLEWLPEFLNLAYQILNMNTHMYIFCSWHNVDVFKNLIQQKFNIKNVLIWEKNNTGMGDLEGAYAPKYELCIYAQKGNKRKLSGGRDSEIIKAKRTNNNLHPTQKPVDLFTYFLEKSTNKNELILDAFSGSGTAALACEEKNRKWICIEKKQKYCDTTVKRLQTIQTTLF